MVYSAYTFVRAQLATSSLLLTPSFLLTPSCIRFHAQLATHGTQTELDGMHTLGAIPAIPTVYDSGLR